MTEVWKRIVDDRLADHYEISNQGRVRVLSYIDRRGRNRKSMHRKYSDAEIWLVCLDGKKRCFPVAQLVLKTFVGPPSESQYLARHLDDNRDNNKVENLAWGTDEDNRADAIRNGVTYISYGHQGHPHSEEAKQKIRNKHLGRPTGRKMTPEHKAAMLAGYRKIFPEREGA